MKKDDTIKKRKNISSVLVFLIFLICIITIIIIDKNTTNYFGKLIVFFIEGIKTNKITGSILYVIILIVSVIMSIPPAIQVTLGGYIYSQIYNKKLGFLIATLLSYFSLIIGGLISYFIVNSFS